VKNAEKTCVSAHLGCRSLDQRRCAKAQEVISREVFFLPIVTKDPKVYLN